MVYTELAPRQQQFHVAPAMPVLKYTTSVERTYIFTCAYYKKHNELSTCMCTHRESKDKRKGKLQATMKGVLRVDWKE